MSKTIFKYAIPVDDQWHEVPAPLPVRVVHVASQGLPDTVFVWAEVNPPVTDTSTRRMRVFGTGRPIPDSACYVGTAQIDPFVWHVYAEASL